MYNSAISTGLCVGGGYLIDKMSEKSKQIIFLIINCIVAVCNIVSNFIGGVAL